MSLIVSPYIRNPQTGEMLDITEKPNAPFNEIFGFEVWRKSVWGSEILKSFYCDYLNSLSHQDIYAENYDLIVLETEINMLIKNITFVIESLNIDLNSFKFRLNNALEAIKIAKKYSNGAVFIG